MDAGQHVRPPSALTGRGAFALRASPPLPYDYVMRKSKPNKSGNGGRREGAGRPPTGAVRRKMGITVKPATYAKLLAAGGKPGATAGQILDEWAEK